MKPTHCDFCKKEADVVELQGGDGGWGCGACFTDSLDKTGFLLLQAQEDVAKARYQGKKRMFKVLRSCAQIVPIEGAISWGYEESEWRWLVVAPGGLSLDSAGNWVRAPLNIKQHVRAHKSGRMLSVEDGRHHFFTKADAKAALAKASPWWLAPKSARKTGAQ